jgi:hypothetical protein
MGLGEQCNRQGLGNRPDGRLTKFIGTNLPMVLPDAGGPPR